MPDIFIQVRGADRVERQLAAVGDATVMSELHDRIATRVLAWVVANVRAGGLERRWAPLSPNTLYARRQSGKGKGAQPLMDTTQMMQSLNKKADARQATVGFGSKVAVFHQWGTRGPYEIAPRFKRALAFPSLWTAGFARQSLGARGFAQLSRGGRRPAFADRLPRAAVQRWLSVRAGTRAGAMGRMPTSQQKGRGLKDYASKNFMVVKSVQHPGLPARPLLPSTSMAQELATTVARNFLAELLQRGGR
jgi:phage gpG-like protein